MKIVLPVLILITLWAGQAFSETHACNDCHIVDDKTGGMALKASLSQLCLECHADRRNPGEHRVDMVPSMKVDKLPLDKDGKITCATCHDPHEKSGYPMLLRDAPADLCEKCHTL